MNRSISTLLLSIIFTFHWHLKSLEAQDDFKTLIGLIQNKRQQSYDSIHSVSFKGHSRTYIYFGYSPLEVDLVPVYDEYYFDGYWMKPDSLRLVIRALRSIDSDSDSMKTTIMENLPLPNPFHYIYDPSMLGFDSEMKDKIWPMYPFATGGDSIYDYRLENEIGDALGLKVDLVEKRALKPTIGQRILAEVVPV